MRYVLTCCLIYCAFALPPSLAASVGVALDKAHYNLRDKASLQRGLRLFQNYCSGCHGTRYQRYNRVAKDLDIPEDLMKQNLIFQQDAKIGHLMTNAMTQEDASIWFGAAPPDLTLVARVRGADWLYTYLRSFYVDPSRPNGVNNLIFPNVGMPHVLESLQGATYPITQEHDVDSDTAAQHIVGLERAENGELTAEEYDQAVLDLVNFLVYSGDPIRLERERLGYWVLAFLLIFVVLTYLLKREYWRDVH